MVEARPRWLVGALLGDSRHVLQPPGGTTACPMPSVIQRRRDPAQSLTALAHLANLIQHGLFGGIRLDVLSVGAEAVAELDVAHALAVGALVAHGVPGSLADRLAFPLAYGRHDVQHEAPSRRAGVERLRDRYQRDAAPLQALKQGAQILHASG